MSIRLRLMIRSGIPFCLVLTLATLLGYAIHTRGQYEDLDRLLVASTMHAVTEAANVSASFQSLSKAGESGGVEIVLRLYGPDGTLRDSTPGAQALPQVMPQSVLQSPAGPAFDALAGLFPPLVTPAAPGEGAFGLPTIAGQRWRIYVLPFRQGDSSVVYVEALTPLKRLDAAMETFHTILLGLWVLGMTATLLSLWIVASNALRPVGHLVQAAQAISRSRDLSRRVDPPPYRDELGQMAETFNDMLKSLEEAQRMQQRFISDASHELRAPLTIVQGNLELLHRQPTMPESERQVALLEMEREAERMARLVADLLTLARADAGITLKRQTVELDVVVFDTLRAARQLAHGQELTLGSFEPVMIEGDEDRLKQLVLILLDNAIKYTPEPGRVALGLRRIETGAEILVADTGVGVAPEALPHVFERFYRADPARARNASGSGLGLAIAHWIVEQHQGQITLESEPGQGTRVTVRLPLCLTSQLPQQPIN